MFYNGTKNAPDRVEIKLSDAFENGEKWCIENDVLKEVLTKHRAEVRSMLFTEWTEEMQQLHYESEMRIARDKGWKQGMEQGMEQGREQGKKKEVFESVYEGDYGIERGAQKLGISEEKFKEEMKAAGYAVPQNV